MVLKKKSLTHILENNNEPEEAPQAPQPQTSQHVQLQTVQTPAAQPPAAPRQASSEADWGELLIKLLASAPEDVAQKLAACIDREVLLKVLEKRDDPYLKVALLLLTKK
jgi:formate dehydrogenase maturation protein FdhE